MVERIQHYCQEEYSQILDYHHARSRALSQTGCEKILIDAGASCGQAKSGAYVYLHHGNHMTKYRRGSQAEYSQILDDFGATNKSPQECIRHLESLGFSYGQSKNAVNQFRVDRGLVGKNR